MYIHPAFLPYLRTPASSLYGRIPSPPLRTLLSLAFSIVLIAVVPSAIYAATVASTYKGKLYQRAGTYEYAPGLFVINGQLKCWFCTGDYDGQTIYNDMIHYSSNPYQVGNPSAYPFTSSQRVLCPSSPGPTGTPVIDFCTADYPSGPDKRHVCDPSVVYVNGTYYLYYTALAYDASNNETNFVFLARSSDGINWVKYPGASQPPVPIITAPYNNRYGAGQQSVVYNDGVFYMYWFQQDWFTQSWIYRATSTNGINFSTPVAIFPDVPVPTSVAAPDLKFVDGWNVWFMISNSDASESPDDADDDLYWNISRDGIHWLPIEWKKAQRTISIGTTHPIHNPGIIGTSQGHLGDGSINSQTFDIAFGDGDPGALQSDLGVATLILSPEPLTGWFDGITASKVAYGWAYDPDTGINDAAANGGPSAPLGHSTYVSVWVDGQPLHNWQPSQVTRCDVRDAGIAPDCYHGFEIDLKPIVPSGTHTIQTQAGEFPTGGGGAFVGPPRTVTMP